MLAALAFLCLVQGSPAVTNTLPDLRVQLDDRDVDLGPVYGEGDAYFVDAAKLTAAVSDGRGEFRTGPSGASIAVDGKTRIAFQNELGRGPEAVCRSIGYAKQLTVKLDSAPVLDAKGRWDIDLADVDKLFGMRAEIDTLTLRLTTPEYWAAKIGIDAPAYAGLNARSVGAGLSFGITPPASDMVVWCRTPGEAFAQIYKFGGSPPLAMIGLDPHDVQQDQPPNPAYLRNVPCGPSKPVRVTTHWVQTEASSETGYGYYACIVIPKSDPRGDPDDALDIAKSGTDHSWLLIGGRQKRLDSPLQFALEPCTVPLTEIARRNFMEISLLRELNGLEPNDTVGPRDKVLVISKVEKIDVPPVPSRLYEVKRGDNVRDLSASWQIGPDQFFAMNPDILAGQSLVEGQIINAPIAAVATGPTPKVNEFTGRAKFTAPIYASSSLSGQTLGAFVTGDPVIVTHEVEPNAYRVDYRDREGYVNKNAVVTDAAPPAASGNTTESPLQVAITTEALNHLGTRYVWGGNNLTSGIDCSHFVAAVLNRARMPNVPSPPVMYQETVGQMTHHKLGPYLHGRSQQFEFTNQVPVTALHPGDRIIIQWSPLDNRTGGRHTGIFIGKYKGMKYAVVHASSSKGVTVTNLLTSWLWKGYRYAVRDPALQ